MKTLRIYDPITHEPLGTVLTTNPELWDEWAEPPPNPADFDRDPGEATWAQLFGIEED